MYHRLLSTLGSCVLFFTVLCQTPELIVQVGHHLSINEIKYSPDGKTIATASDDNTVKIWEIATGKEMHTLFGHTKAVNAIAFSPDSKTIVSVGDDRKVIIWDAETGERLKEIDKHKNKVLTVDYSPTGGFFATAGKDKTVLLHTVSTGKIKELYEFKSEVNKVRFLNSGNYLYTETDKLLSKNAFFSIPQGKMVTWVPGGGATSISFDSEDRKFMTGRVNYGSPSVNIIKDWEKISDWKKSKEPLWKGLIPYNFQDTTGDFKVFSLKNQDNYDISKVESDSEGAIGSEGSLAAFFSKDGKDDIVAGNQFGELLFWKYEDIKFFPRTTNPYANLNEKIGNMYATPYKVIDAHEAPILDAVSSRNGDYIFTSAKNGEMKLWDVNLERNIQTFTSGAVLPMYAVAFGSGGKTMILSTGLKDRYVVELSSMEVVDYFQNENTIERYAFSKDRSMAVMGFYNSSYFHLIDMEDKEIIRTFKGHLGEITSLVFGDDQQTVISTATEGKKITWNLATGEILKNEVAEKTGASLLNNSKLKLEKGKLSVLLTSDQGTYKLAHLNKITSWGYTPDEKYAFTASMDGSLSLWDPVTGQNTVRIMVTSEKEVIAVTHDYYFMASKKALKGIAFKHQGKMYPFEQFDFQFNRPDIVLERVGYADKRLIKAYNISYKKRSAQLGVTGEGSLSFNTPDLQIALADLPRSSDKKDFAFSYSGKDAQEELKSILLKVNGVPQSQRPVSGKQIKGELNIELSSGENKIEVSLVNEKGVSSLAQTFQVTYLNKEPKRNLYLITVGVSDYENQDFNLNYAAKDAKDLTALFTSKNDMFEEVHHLNFLNDQATPQNIKTAKEKLKQSSVDDYVVFFFAGHGLLDRQLNYYLAMHHIAFEDPAAGGMPYEQVEDLLSYIPARNKLILIDACHSGELEKQSVSVSRNTSVNAGGKLTTRGYSQVHEKTGMSRILGFGNLFKFMKSQFADLRENTGTIVISSAGGAEYALESAEWKNGVFTFYMKQGLISGEADLNKDGRIYASELQAYLSQRVFEATGGKQRPTTRVENLSFDLLVWEK